MATVFGSQRQSKLALPYQGIYARDFDGVSACLKTAGFRVHTPGKVLGVGFAWRRETSSGSNPVFSLTEAGTAKAVQFVQWGSTPYLFTQDADFNTDFELIGTSVLNEWAWVYLEVGDAIQPRVTFSKLKVSNGWKSKTFAYPAPSVNVPVELSVGAWWSSYWGSNYEANCSVADLFFVDGESDLPTIFRVFNGEAPLAVFGDRIKSYFPLDGASGASGLEYDLLNPARSLSAIGSPALAAMPRRFNTTFAVDRSPRYFLFPTSTGKDAPPAVRKSGLLGTRGRTARAHAPYIQLSSKWRTQPTGPLEVNPKWANSLISLWTPTSLRAVGTVSGGTAFASQTTPGGMSKTTYPDFSPGSATIPTNGEYTFFTYFWGASLSGFAGLAGIGNESPGLYAYDAVAGGVAAFESSARLAPVAPYVPDSRRGHTAALTRYGGNAYLWCDGQIRASQASSTSYGGQINFGWSGYSQSRDTAPPILIGGLWSRGFSDVMLAELESNPWDLFRPIRRSPQFYFRKPVEVRRAIAPQAPALHLNKGWRSSVGSRIIRGDIPTPRTAILTPTNTRSEQCLAPGYSRNIATIGTGTLPTVCPDKFTFPVNLDRSLGISFYHHSTGAGAQDNIAMLAIVKRSRIGDTGYFVGLGGTRFNGYWYPAYAFTATDDLAIHYGTTGSTPSTVVTSSGSLFASTSEIFAVGITVNRNGKARVYGHGRQLASASWGNSAASDYSFCIGYGYYGQYRAFEGDYYAGCIWHSTVPAGMMEELTSSPYALFNTRPRRIYVGT